MDILVIDSDSMRQIKLDWNRVYGIDKDRFITIFTEKYKNINWARLRIY